jgi:hypothetical protein
MKTMTDFSPLGPVTTHNRDADWATAHNVIAADDDLGLDVAITAHFAEMLASLWWAANGDDFHEAITFGPWTVTSDSECDWLAMGVDAPVVEVLYDGHGDEEPKHVATVAIDNIGG